MNSKLRSAFTLVELLVVIAIIGILSGLIIVGMNSSIQQATVAKSQIFSSSLRDSLLMNLVSEWKLDGNANDSWSGGNSGSFVGTVNSSTDCVVGSCYSFTGNNSYITIPDKSNQAITDAVTIELWIKTSANQPNTYPFIFGKHWRYYLSIPQNTNTVSFVLSGPGTLTSSTISLNKWNYVVGTYNKDGGNNNQKIYINGEISNQRTATGTIATVANPMYFGVADSSQATVGFVGSIDETRLYNNSIPVSQIKEHYYAGINYLLAKGELSKIEYFGLINEYE